MLSPRKLKKLRVDAAAYNERWVAAGRRLTKYHCGHCHQKIDTPRPRKSQVQSDRGCWSSAMTCTNCGGLNFVRVYPSGRTIAHTPEDEQCRS